MKEHKIDKASCKEVMNHICETMGEDLDSDKCVAIKHHLDECNSCKNYFSTVEKTINFYKMYDVKISETAHKRLLDYLGLEED